MDLGQAIGTLRIRMHFKKASAMQNQSSQNKSTLKKIMRRVWFWIFIGLVIVGVLFFIMLPVGIDYGIERYLKDQGGDCLHVITSRLINWRIYNHDKKSDLHLLIINIKS